LTFFVEEKGELMCSTPRPKRKIKSTASGSVSGTLLSNLSAQKRADFVKRANSADERRQQIKHQKSAQKQTLSLVNNTRKKAIKTKMTPTKSWSYWFVDASIKEIFMLLFFGKSYKH